MIKKRKNRKFVSFKTEVVDGRCPTCEEDTKLVGIDNTFYRCISCGADLEQHVNGKISYLPVMASTTDGRKYSVREWEIDK